MNGNYFALYVYTVVYGRGLCLQVMQKLVDSEGLAKMFDESGVVEMVEVLSSYLFIITNLGFGMDVPLCVSFKCLSNFSFQLEIMTTQPFDNFFKINTVAKGGTKEIIS